MVVIFGSILWAAPRCSFPFGVWCNGYFFARLEHSPISRVGRGSLLLWLFGLALLSSTLAPCASQRGWLGSAVCALVRVLLRPLHTCTALLVLRGRFRGHLALHGDPGSLEPFCVFEALCSFSSHCTLGSFGNPTVDYDRLRII